jgi:hypothetical protein
LLGAYLAFGKYNSRDSEIYVLQAILFVVKPRKLVYVRVPELYDLEEKLGKITANSIALRMRERLENSKAKTQTAGFDDLDRENKAQTIMSLARRQDEGTSNAMGVAANLGIQRTKLEQLLHSHKTGSQGLTRLSQDQYTPSQLLKEQGVADASTENTRSQLDQQNFFQDDSQFK